MKLLKTETGFSTNFCWVRYSQYLWKHRNYTSAKTDPLPDANLLKGSKAIAEKVDVGCILLPLTESDREFLEGCMEKGYPTGRVNTKLSVYKNRSGEFVRAYLWLDFDKSTCRYETILASDWDYNKKEIKSFDIKQGLANVIW